MNIKPCPPECTFDWMDFHRKLDTAFAHFVEEYPELTAFSDRPIIELLKYSNAKQKLQKEAKSK